MNDSVYFSGHKVYGDDMSLNDIEKWYSDEENGYYNLINTVYFKDRDYVYQYHALNEYHGYRHIRDRRYRRVLALGCARGDDVAPISANADEYFAIEPAEKWWSPTIGGKPAQFVKPNVSGDIRCRSGEVDLTICLGVLHHIPNVTHVINEISRVSSRNGRFILREPISTMGDWRKPRIGLTKNERGFPIKWLDNRLSEAGFVFERRAFCVFPLTAILGKLFGVSAYSSRGLVALDHIMGGLTLWNYHYHRDSLFKKIGPTSAFYILRKV